MAAEASRSARKTPAPDSVSSRGGGGAAAIAAAARSSRRRAARARDTCAHGHPEPCTVLGGLSLSLLLSASRNSASLQSLSDAVTREASDLHKIMRRL